VLNAYLLTEQRFPVGNWGAVIQGYLPFKSGGNCKLYHIGVYKRAVKPNYCLKKYPWLSWSSTSNLSLPSTHTGLQVSLYSLACMGHSRRSLDKDWARQSLEQSAVICSSL